MRLRPAFKGLALLFLAACTASEPPLVHGSGFQGLDDHPDGPSVTLFTVVSKRSGTGAHSGLLITTLESKILFDPAGSFALSYVPERNDVHFGITSQIVETYIDYHARETYDVIAQRVPVTAAQADQIAQLAKDYGPVPRAQCALSINRILQKVQGFERMTPSFFPVATSQRFGMADNVTRRVITDTDADANGSVLQAAGP